MPLILVILSISLCFVFVHTSSLREFTSLENAFFQVFILILSLSGSFLLGKQSAKEAAREIIKPHARSALRRLMSLYASLSRAAQVLKEPHNPTIDQLPVLIKLEIIVIELLSTADDSVEDWNDIVPEEVNKLRDKAKTKIEGENK